MRRKLLTIWSLVLLLGIGVVGLSLLRSMSAQVSNFASGAAPQSATRTINDSLALTVVGISVAVVGCVGLIATVAAKK